MAELSVVGLAVSISKEPTREIFYRTSIKMMASGGVLAGTAIALGASRAVARMLFATSARDTATFVLVPAMLALVALLDPGAARGVDRSGGGAAGRVRGRA